MTNVINRYVIEDNLDFKSELNNSNNENNADVCLISQQQLTKSHIMLPCSHKFNYMPLFNEIYTQKKKNMYAGAALKVNQIKCPYCRVKFDELMPYLPGECSEKTTGVNYPFKYCMKLRIECDWINKTGKNKGIKCSKDALYLDVNCYCKTHYHKINKINNIIK